MKMLTRPIQLTITTTTLRSTIFVDHNDNGGVYDNPNMQNIAIYEDGNSYKPKPHGDTGLGYNAINNGKYGEQNKNDTEVTIEYFSSVIEEEKQWNKYGNVGSARL